MYINNNNITIWELPMSRNWVILPPLLTHLKVFRSKYLGEDNHRIDL